jgi:hypothetical protein
MGMDHLARRIQTATLDSFMSKRAITRTGRHSYQRAVFEVQRWASAVRGRKKKLAIALGFSTDQAQLSARLRLDGKASFTVDQFGIIAEEAGAPMCWPFISWEEASLRERFYQRGLGAFSPLPAPDHPTKG